MKRCPSQAHVRQTRSATMQKVASLFTRIYATRTVDCAKCNYANDACSPPPRGCRPRAPLPTESACTAGVSFSIKKTSRYLMMNSPPPNVLLSSAGWSAPEMNPESRVTLRGGRGLGEPARVRHGNQLMRMAVGTSLAWD